MKIIYIKFKGLLFTFFNFFKVLIFIFSIWTERSIIFFIVLVIFININLKNHYIIDLIILILRKFPPFIKMHSYEKRKTR